MAFSAACGSMSRRLSRPRQHPATTPHTLPAVDVVRVTRITFCSVVSTGCVNPARSTHASMAPPKSTPLVSLKIWPIAAAAREERPNATPTLLSMASPA